MNNDSTSSPSPQTNSPTPSQEQELQTTSALPTTQNIACNSHLSLTHPLPKTLHASPKLPSHQYPSSQPPLLTNTLYLNLPTPRRLFDVFNAAATSLVSYSPFNSPNNDYKSSETLTNESTRTLRKKEPVNYNSTRIWVA